VKNLAELQGRMQDAVLRDCSADGLVASPPRGNRDDRVAVYRNAYRLRLTEFLAHDYEKLRTYLGEVRFNEMALRYIAAHPSDQPNARWFSRHLPEFLASSRDYSHQPELYELARLERALNDAFDGRDENVCTMGDLGAIHPELFGSVSFKFVSTVQRFAVTTNVSSLWSSLKCDEIPPRAESLAKPLAIMVWRQGTGARFRILVDEEAMAIDSAREGVNFSIICEMIAAFDDPDNAAMRAAGYLRGWIEAEIISSVRGGGGMGE
jgi:hypothetical protein